MKKFETLLLHLVNLATLVFLGFALSFLLSWFIHSGRMNWTAFIGAPLGLILWFTFRGRLLNLLLHNLIYQIALDFILMLGAFGMFMGVPVFNILPGILLAWVTAIQARKSGSSAEEFSRSLRRIMGITLAILFLFLAASAAIALWDPYTAANLQGMFRLAREVTRAQIIAIILAGGLGLLVLQAFLQYCVGRWAYSRRPPYLAKAQ